MEIRTVMKEIQDRVSYGKVIRTINTSTCPAHLKACKRMVYNYHGLYGNMTSRGIIADRANTLLYLIKLKREVLGD